jgi:hypothetical protein
MTCDEFEAIGLDAERDTSLMDAQRANAAAHAASCARCAALRNSWEAARLELRSLAQASANVDAPARIEMRLRQQFRTQYHMPKVRRTAVAAAWALAAAAVLVGALSWINWRNSKQPNIAVKSNTPISNVSTPEQNATTDSQALVANNELNGFTLLPGVLPADTEDAAILRVRMQRGTLGALGLPVNEDRAAEWIQVDLLVGSDGLPQAVRLPNETRE